MNTQGQEAVTLKVGTRLYSAVCTTAVIVVRPPKAALELTCGGHPMLAEPSAAPLCAPDPQFAQGTALTKRYRHEVSGLEVICTKGGSGTLAVDREPLTEQAAKSLPSSD